jgi:hypothetical protein
MAKTAKTPKISFLRSSLVDSVFGTSGKSLFQVFEDRSVPWIVRVYLSIFAFIMIALLIVTLVALFRSNEAVVDKVFPYLGDALKVTLGAMLGSLSVAAERILIPATADDETPPETPPTPEDVTEPK